MNEMQKNLDQSIDPPHNILARLVDKLSQGAVDEVLKASQVLAIKHRKSIQVWKLIGSAAFQKSELRLAETALKHVVSLSSNDPVAFANLGKVQHRLGEAKDAIASFQKSISINSNVDDSWFNLGLSFTSLGDASSAIGAYQQTIKLNPTHYGALVALATKLREFNEFVTAIDLLKKATQINANDVTCWLELGLNFQEIGQVDDALNVYRKACEVAPTSATAKNKLGLAYEASGDLTSAIEAYKIATSLDLGCVDAWIDLGAALYKAKEFENSKAAFEQAIDLSPVYSFYRLSQLERNEGKVDRAINYLKKALDLEPDNPAINDSLGIAHLLNEDFKVGFELYEWRWRNANKSVKPHAKRLSGEYLQSTRPVWRGEPNQNVLVWAEQGIGDEIMFASMISDLFLISNKIILSCDYRLISIFKRSLPAGIQFVEKDKKVAEEAYDYHLPIGSLPRFFRPNKKSFVKSANPYLCCATPRVNQIRRTLKVPKAKILVGISWQTKSLLSGATKRNISLSDLVSKFNNEKVCFVNLQYGDVAGEIRLVKRQTDVDIIEAPDIDKNDDLDGLSHLISACDYIVTIDNFIAHLSGALGKDTRVLLPRNNDWRWAQKKDTSYWYNSVKLCHKDEKIGWQGHLKEINAEITSNEAKDRQKLRT